MHQVIKGMFMVDGLDGCGKGTIVNELRSIVVSSGGKCFDARAHQKSTGEHPPRTAFDHADCILTSEPTYAGHGRDIRERLIRKSDTKEKFSAMMIAEAYSKDREELYRKVILPASSKGKLIFQERGVVSSMVYQPVHARTQGNEITREEIVRLAGNAFCLSRPPEYLIIPKVSARTAMERIGKREKQDHAEFEKLSFLSELESQYYGNELKNYFSDLGTTVIYIDTEKGMDETLRMTRNIWNNHIKKQRI